MSRYDRIKNALSRANDSRIAVVGDFCLDKYLFIDPDLDELSLETNQVAYQVTKTVNAAGIGGTVTNNLCSLGGNVECVGIIGKDGGAYDLLKALRGIGANTEAMYETEQLATNIYIKPMRRQPDETFIELNRFDIRQFKAIPQNIEQDFLEKIKIGIKDCKGVIITDQFLEENHSALTKRVREALSKMAEENPSKYFYVDSRGFAKEYRNMMVKCNNIELVNNYYSVKEENITNQLIWECGQRLRKEINGVLIVTRGEKGSLIFENNNVTEIPGFTAIPPLDIVGAGDASNAGIMLGLTLGLSLEDAAVLGNCVSSITIEKLGVTGTASAAEVLERLKQLS